MNRTYSLKIHLDKMPKLIEMNTIQYPMVDSKNQKLDAFYEKGILFFNVDLKNETVHIKIQH